MALKPSEYCGSDTHKTQGVQPAPHQVTQTEELRLIYATDPADVASIPDATRPKVSVPNDPTPVPLWQDL